MPDQESCADCGDERCTGLEVFLLAVGGTQCASGRLARKDFVHWAGLVSIHQAWRSPRSPHLELDDVDHTRGDRYDVPFISQISEHDT